MLRFRNYPIHRIEWVTTVFLSITLVLSLFVAPVFVYNNWSNPAINWPVVLTTFLVMYVFTGMSITLGYHRLFSHISFKAAWPVKLFTLIFGAAAFENSCLDWSADHRNHHKHVDHDDDPYDISKGFFYAHMGWVLFKLKPQPPFDNVKDLMNDKMVMWQHKWNHLIAGTVSFILPFAAGYAIGHAMTNGENPMPMAWAMLLVGGVLRVTAVQQSTFCINSLCHTLGKQTYSSSHTARDSWICALVTFGEGYHNYHHEFQHDYRNAVRWWQWDPTKWTIWTLHKIGLAKDLRRVPEARILAAEVNEARRVINKNLETFSQRLPAATRELKADAIQAVQIICSDLETKVKELQAAAIEKTAVPKEKMKELRARLEEARAHLNSIRMAYAAA